MEIINKSTLIPISCLGVVVAASFWFAGLAKDVQATQLELVRIRSDRTSLEAEIISQLRSNAMITQEQGQVINTIQVSAAASEAKLAIILKLIERNHLK